MGLIASIRNHRHGPTCSGHPSASSVRPGHWTVRGVRPLTVVLGGPNKSGHDGAVVTSRNAAARELVRHHPFSTNPSSTFFAPALSKSTDSLLPSTAVTLP
jgi:hypothetical protein